LRYGAHGVNEVGGSNDPAPVVSMILYAGIGAAAVALIDAAQKWASLVNPFTSCRPIIA